VNNHEKLKEIGLKIAYYRKKKGLRQQDLAELIFVSKDRVSKIESPNSKAFTSVLTLLAIADALEIDVRQLFDFGE